MQLYLVRKNTGLTELNQRALLSQEQLQLDRWMKGLIGFAHVLRSVCGIRT